MTAFSPSQLLTGTFPQYLSGGRGAGALVLAVDISNTGAVGLAAVVRDIPTLAGAAQAALKNWTFNAATYGNTYIASKVVVAMVFRNPRTALP